MCGDAGSTRLFKDGLGAAYIMGKAAATTAVFHGVSKKHFEENYYPTYKSLITDNRFGRVLFAVTNLYKKYRIVTTMMLEVVRREQQAEDNRRKVLSSVLWDTFTGNERYKNIFFRALDPGMNIAQVTQLVKVLVRRRP